MSSPGPSSLPQEAQRERSRPHQERPWLPRSATTLKKEPKAPPRRKENSVNKKVIVNGSNLRRHQVFSLSKEIMK